MRANVMRSFVGTSLGALGLVSLASLAALALAGCASSAESAGGASGSSGSDLAIEAASASVITPFGKMNAACVHALPDVGASGSERDSEEATPVDESSALASCASIAPAAFKPDTDTEPPGWVEWADQDLASGVSFLSADFTVPPVPTSVGDQVIFLFPSLTPATNPPILQPVLQFGEAADGGGRYWSIANWYLTTAANSFNSKVVKVAAGDKLRGTLQGTGTCSAGRCASWTVTLADLTQPTLKTTLTTEAGRHHFTQLQGAALETYQLDGCDQYPAGPIAFTNITVKTNAGAALTPAWKLFDNATASPACAFKATSPSPSEIDFAFSN